MRLITIAACICCWSCSGQSSSDDPLEIQILNDSLQIFAHEPQLLISLKSTNKTDKNLILYGFDSNVIKPAKTIQQFCNIEGLGAGIAVFVFNDKNQNEFATFYIPDELKNKPMPKDTFENTMVRLKAKYLAGTMFLKAFESSYADKSIDLKDFELEKGTYNLQVVYYSGKVVEKLAVGKSRVEADKRKNNADLYQGCVISNRITFRVD